MNKYFSMLRQSKGVLFGLTAQKKKKKFHVVQRFVLEL